MLFVALSCLQGRPMRAAFDDLARLGVGIQLTPGNLPTPEFREHVAASGVTTRRHHGFAFDARKTATWSESACVVESESVHPPLAGENVEWRAWFERAPAPPILEVMYPGYALGTGDEVERVMDDGVTLAVDVSHVFLQIAQGTMHERTWRRLADYDRIAEVHVSANRGRADTHQPLTAETFGLDWARERVANGDAVILECYMHRFSDEQRRQQLELLR
jgi:sugar phosphate isomerase/epimerase